MSTHEERCVAYAAALANRINGWKYCNRGLSATHNGDASVTVITPRKGTLTVVTTGDGFDIAGAHTVKTVCHLFAYMDIEAISVDGVFDTQCPWCAASVKCV